MKLLAYAAAFFLVAARFRSKEQIALLVKTILFVAAALVVVAVVQKLTWNGKMLWFYPPNKEAPYNWFIWGPYANRNHFAGYLAMVIPLGLGLLLYTAPVGRAVEGLSWRKRLWRKLTHENLVRSALTFLLVLLLTACLLATLSGGGIMAAAIAVLFFFCIAYRRRTLRRRTAQSAMLAAAVGAAVLMPVLGRFVQRLSADSQRDVMSRLHVWGDSLVILKDFPLFGTGLGTYGQIFRRYQTHQFGSYFDHAHNDYLEMAADTGALGFLLAAGMAAVFCVALLRGWKSKHGMFGKAVGAGGIASCLAMAVLSGVDFNLRIPANALLFTVVAALTWASIFNHHREPESEQGEGIALQRRASPKRRPLVVLCALLVAGLLISLPVRAFFADRDYRLSTSLGPLTRETFPDYLMAAGSLRRATALAPSRPAYHRALADVFARMGVWATTMQGLGVPLPAGVMSGKEALAIAVREMTAAVRLEPMNSEYHLALGRLHAASGDAPRAGDEFGKAAKSLPGNAPLRQAVAAAYLSIGNRAAALEHATALARMDVSYLPKALEIADGAGADDATLRAMVPGNEASRGVLEDFKKNKGSGR